MINGGVRVYKKFEGVDEEYFATMKISPSTYGYIHTNSVIVGDNATECYKILRDIEYESFGSLKDRFYVGLLSIYAEIFKAMEGNVYDENSFTNLYALAFETDNNIKNKVISFDIVLIESTEEELLKNEKLKECYNKYIGRDKSKHSAAFNYGMLYKNVVTDLDLLNTVFHLKAFKIQENGANKVKLPSSIYYNNDNPDNRDFISNLLNDDTDLLKYIVGLSKEVLNET